MMAVDGAGAGADGMHEASSIASGRGVAESQRRAVRDRQCSHANGQSAFEAALKNVRRRQASQEMSVRDAAAEDASGMPANGGHTTPFAATAASVSASTPESAQVTRIDEPSAALKAGMNAADALPPLHGRWQFELHGEALPISGIAMLRSPEGELAVSVQAPADAGMPSIEPQMQRLRRRLLERGVALDPLHRQANDPHD